MDRPLRGALYVRRSLSPNLPLTSPSPPSLIRSTENYPIPIALPRPPFSSVVQSGSFK